MKLTTVQNEYNLEKNINLLLGRELKYRLHFFPERPINIAFQARNTFYILKH